jgi:hypothetical protein
MRSHFHDLRDYSVLHTAKLSNNVASMKRSGIDEVETHPPLDSVILHRAYLLNILAAHQISAVKSYR